jgi:alkaline phosphatase D
MRLSRRTVLRAAPALCTRPLRAEAAPGTSFPFSVASGDPTDSSVILWTRLARATHDPEPVAAGPVTVEWCLAEDRHLSRAVRRGNAHALPCNGFSVHVDVTGLEPDRPYFYAFRLGGLQSPVGRTRTLPDRRRLPSGARIALASCQDWESGFFDAYRGMVADDPDLVLHVGDYIYDVTRGGGVRAHETQRLPMTLADYRARHALYRSDPALQAAHESLTFALIPDNHDALEQDSDDPAKRRRRAAAWQAYGEFLPLRRRARRGSDWLPIHRSVDIGRLARLYLMDTRQVRRDEFACASSSDPAFGLGVYQRACEELANPTRSMLGKVQEQWLAHDLATSPAVWNALVSTVLVSPLALRNGADAYVYPASWSGYPHDRRRLLVTLRRIGAANPVALSGDLHSTLVAQVVERAGDDPRRSLLPEFLGTSISSLWPEPLADPIRSALSANPHVLHYDPAHRGYLLCHFTAASLTVETRLLSTALQPGGVMRTGERFAVLAGNPAIHRL